MAHGNGRQCKAKSKRTGKRCRANCVTGSNVCYHHGGQSLKGLASPTHKTGFYSSHLPAKLSTQYQELLDLGQDLFKIDNETSIVTALIGQQLERMESGESGAAWGKLQDLYDEMAVLGQKPDKSATDVQRFNALFVELGKIIGHGSMAFSARSEAVGLMEQKRKMVSDERKDWAAKHQAMSFDRVLLILTAFVHSFRQSLEKHITDDKDRRLVLTDAQDFLDHVLRK